jgi:ppGpp synthetase/RelA/SpoT-type nucleotidyltranferase
MSIADQLAEVVYKVGTVRKRKDGEYQKVRPGEWVRVGKESPMHGVAMAAQGGEVKRLGSKASRAEKRAREEAKLPGTVSAVAELVDSGHLAKGLSVDDHRKIAEDTIRLQQGALRPFLRDLSKLAGNGEVSGRLKTLESVLGKLVRRHHVPMLDKDGNDIVGKDGNTVFDMSKPKLQRADQLSDITGARITHDTLDEVYKTAAKIVETYGEDRIAKMEDRVKQPLSSGYRSLHFDVIDFDGNKKEIQVRTRNQHRWAEWNHDFYKPRTENQVTWKKGAEAQAIKVFEEYAKTMSEHFLAADSGKKPKPPPCPEAVRKSPFGCL